MKTFFIYFIETAIAGALLWFDQRLFLLYFFVIVIWAIDSKVDHLRKIIRVNGFIDECRTLAIAEHLNVPKEKMNKIYQDAINRLDQEKRKEFEKDYQDLMQR